MPDVRREDHRMTEVDGSTLFSGQWLAEYLRRYPVEDWVLPTSDPHQAGRVWRKNGVMVASEPPFRDRGTPE